jgi:hypothetical protein
MVEIFATRAECRKEVAHINAGTEGGYDVAPADGTENEGAKCHQYLIEINP